MAAVSDKQRQSGVALGLLALAFGLGWGAIDISSEAGYAGIGPNFLPWLVAAGLAVLGAILLFEAHRGGFRNMPDPMAHDAPAVSAPCWGGFVWMSGALLLNAALITRIGFVLSCALCFACAAHGLRQAQSGARQGLRSWLVDGAIGLLISAPVYWMFTKFLAISLPGLTQSGWL
jgi:putative tricarboxylic transport membrane protein